MNTSKIVLLFAITLFLFSCKKEPSFTIDGEISGAKDTTIYLEKRGLSSIVLIDSAKVDNNGKFKFNSPAPEYPELYVLKLGNQYINLSIDSTETITINASLKNFASDYSVDTENNKLIKEITQKNRVVTEQLNDLSEKLETKAIDDKFFADSATTIVNNFKKYTIDIIIKNPKSIVSYYALFQKVDNTLLLDPYDKKESRIYGAVATQWDNYYPESERAKHLKSFILTAMKAQKNAENQSQLLKDLTAKEINMLDIVLPDIQNKKIDLKDYKGKVIILDFISYTLPESPAHNSILNKAYEKYGNNIIIYQISLDPDMHTWKNAAGNLPWICVRDAESADSRLINQYNIQALPTTFIINKEGDIVKRVLPKDNLDSEVSKVL